MKKQDLIEFIPIILLLFFTLEKTLSQLTILNDLSYQYQIGLGMLVCSIVLFFLHKRIYRYVMAFTLVFITISIIDLPKKIDIGISIAVLKIQIIPLAITGVFAWIHKEKVVPTLRQLVGKSDEILASETRLRVDHFKEKFEHLSNAEIKEKLSENLVPEAKQALKELKEEKSHE